MNSELALHAEELQAAHKLAPSASSGPTQPSSLPGREALVLPSTTVDPSITEAVDAPLVRAFNLLSRSLGLEIESPSADVSGIQECFR